MCTEDLLATIVGYLLHVLIIIIGILQVPSSHLTRIGSSVVKLYGSTSRLIPNYCTHGEH